MNRWPVRPETLINRLEAALLTMANTPMMSDPATIKRVQDNYQRARLDLLARITPAPGSDFQARRARRAGGSG